MVVMVFVWQSIIVTSIASHVAMLFHIASVFQRIGRSRFISITDCKAGYWTIPLRE